MLVHARQVHETVTLGMGLGINTTEGREAKHIALAKFTNNTQFSNRWVQVFKHEYMTLFWLQENGCDETVYKETPGVYIPKRCNTLPSFATVGYLKILMMGNATSVLSSCVRYSVTDCVIQGKPQMKLKHLQLIN